MDENVKIEELNQYTSLITLSGRLDFETSPKVKPHIDKLVQAEKKVIMVDASQLEFIASQGLGIFLYASKDMAKKNGEIWLVATQPQVEKVFTTMRVQNMFRFFKDLAEAKEQMPC